MDQNRPSTECKHTNKSFANFSYASNPPQTPWICKDCGHEGIQRGAEMKNDYAYFKNLHRK